MTIDRLAEGLGVSLRKPLLRPYAWGEGEVEGRKLYLAQPLTFMNRSGEVVPELLERANLPVACLVVVCDNLDLPAGVCRLKHAGGSAGHHGLESIIARLGDASFHRLYVGIGRPLDGNVIEYVLGDPPEEERPLYAEAVERAARGIITLLTRSPSEAMNELNKRASPTPPKG